MRQRGKPGPIVVDAGAARDLVQQPPVGPLSCDTKCERYTCHALREWLQQVSKKAGVTGVILHGYRHTFCTRLLDAGLPDAHVASPAGHKGTATLTAHHEHLLNTTREPRPALRRLPDASTVRDAAAGPDTG
jgi:integrase